MDGQSRWAGFTNEEIYEIAKSLSCTSGEGLEHDEEVSRSLSKELVEEFKRRGMSRW